MTTCFTYFDSPRDESLGVSCEPLGSVVSAPDSEAPPVGLEESVKTLENTLNEPCGGNAGGNLSDTQLASLTAWSQVYQTAASVLRRVAES